MEEPHRPLRPILKVQTTLPEISNSDHHSIDDESKEFPIGDNHRGRNTPIGR